MGIYRSIPQNHVDFYSQQHSLFQFAVASTCGWKIYQQDFYFYCKYNQKVYCMGILDGHCGPQVAKYCEQQIPILIKNNELLKIGQYQAGVQNICQSLDQRIKDCPEKLNLIRKKYDLPQLPEYCQTQSGASLVMCLISQEQIVIGNIGQCKCYVSYKQNQSKAVLISGNHTPSNSQQYDRVQASNGFFLNHLVNGKFSFTRSIGDLLYKVKDTNKKQSILISTPSVFCLRRQDLRFLVMGSSGFWQQPQKVLKQLLLQDLQFYELKTKLHGLVQDLIAKKISQSQHYGLNNITGLMVSFN